MKLKTFILCFLLLSCAVSAGCEKQAAKSPDLIPAMINQTADITDQAIKNKDIKLAREIWSQVSEYGIKAKEMGKEDLAKLVNELAATYTDLIEYLEKGDVLKLESFRIQFNQNLTKLRHYANTNIK